MGKNSKSKIYQTNYTKKLIILVLYITVSQIRRDSGGLRCLHLPFYE